MDLRKGFLAIGALAGSLAIINCGSQGPATLSTAKNKGLSSVAINPNGNPNSNPTPYPTPNPTPVITPGGGGGGGGGTFQVVHDASDFRPPFQLVGGPVTSVHLVVFWAERPSGSGQLYQPPFDGRCYKVLPGDRIMLDSTPKGVGCGNWNIGQCDYDQGPVWSATADPQFYHVPKDDNGFLMRVKPQVHGAEDRVVVNVDGVNSNEVCLSTR
ncbi:MAG: hypothetical protein IT289_13375 [Oligoflexia bacterium]|nr:hypothetical protein [Oligoflexia bacterium]